jgi:hypothetical protein
MLTKEELDEALVTCRLVIVKDAIKSSALASALTSLLPSTALVKTSVTASSDLLFSYPSGSLAFGFYSIFDESSLTSMLKLEKSSRRSYAVFRDVDDDMWMQAQQSLPAGKLQMLRSNSFEESVDIVLRILSIVNNEKKARQQIEYFHSVLCNCAILSLYLLVNLYFNFLIIGVELTSVIQYNRVDHERFIFEY